MAVLAVTLLGAGCDLRMMDPRWHALAKHGVAFVPGESGHATFLMGTTTDEEFMEVVDDLKRVRVRHLDLKDTGLTDASIEGLLQLKHLEVLEANATNFSAEGLARLGTLPRLRRVYVANGQFSEEELSRLRSALPAIEPNMLGEWNYLPSTNPASSTTRPTS